MTTQTRRKRRLLLVAVGLALVFGASACDSPYLVALFGDVPYSTSKEPAYDRMLAQINDTGVAFSTHVGDFQARTSDCTDANVDKNVARFDSLNQPLVYTPGDNDWTDCNSPLTRLSRLREIVYRGSTGTLSRGKAPMTLTSQASLGYPENAEWFRSPITFVTIHVVGSSDGSANKTEQTARRNADIAWLHQAFSDAKSRGDKGIVIMAQAGLRFEYAEGTKGSFESMFVALRNETLAFAGKVLYVHGDLHTFRDDQPMKKIDGTTVANFRRVEVYGDPTVRWVQLKVDPTGANLFTITSPPIPSAPAVRIAG